MLWKRKDSDGCPTTRSTPKATSSSRGKARSSTASGSSTATLTERGAIVDVRLKAYSKDLKTRLLRHGPRGAHLAQVDATEERRQEMVAEDVQADQLLLRRPALSPHRSAHATLLGGEQPKSEEKKRRLLVRSATTGRSTSTELIPGVQRHPVPLRSRPLRRPVADELPAPLDPGRPQQPRSATSSTPTSGSRIRFKDEQGEAAAVGRPRPQDRLAPGARPRPAASSCNYKWDDYKGYLDSYYLHDLGPPPRDPTFDTPVPAARTVRTAARPTGSTATSSTSTGAYELEAYYLSDRSLLEEFFPHGVQGGEGARDRGLPAAGSDNMGGYPARPATASTSSRRRTSTCPARTSTSSRHPILGGWVDNLYLTERVDIVDIRHKFDERPRDSPSVDTWRVDAVTQIFDAASTSRGSRSRRSSRTASTYYEDDLTRRPAGAGPLDGRSPRHRPDPRRPIRRHRGSGWASAGCAHVIEIEARYTNNFCNNVDPAELLSRTSRWTCSTASRRWRSRSASGS